MKLLSLLIIILVQILSGSINYSQADTERPTSPVLNLVTVNQPSGTLELTWSLSPSPDVAGYVVYTFRDNAGFEPDTIRDPYATSYIRGLASPYFSDSLVVAAIDSSGNISPLSNELHTVFLVSSIDTCNKRLDVQWNSYSSSPKKVTSYSILVSVNGGNYVVSQEVPANINNYVLNDFSTNSQYCFLVRANLDGGFNSLSNKGCVITKMQRLPLWINADYATINSGNEISLSFTIDPSSQISHFSLERKNKSAGTYNEIAKPESSGGKVLYIDKQADIKTVNSYRLTAINNCNKPLTTSNYSSNIVLTLERKENDLIFSWNAYRSWTGKVSSYILLINTGNGFHEKAVLPPSDTIYKINYSDIMYEITDKEACFYVAATEISNPHGIKGYALSSTVCTIPTENITVPNVFTPNNDLVNDFFKPVLSFIPTDYHMIISDKTGKVLFETRDFHAVWDGSQGGNPLPTGAYLWFMKVSTPSGKNISKTGTITIIKD
jgi:gliding motility-associated-like protein